MPSRTQQFFPASFDTTSKVISAIVCAVLALVVLVTRSWIGIGVAVLAIGLSYAWSPRGYTLSGRTILVKRLIGHAQIPLEDVREARAATADDFRWAVRLFGDGGLFGYYGLFRTSNLGNCRWYLTSRANAIVIVTGEKTVLVSPDDVPGFLAMVRAVAGTPAPVRP